MQAMTTGREWLPQPGGGVVSVSEQLALLGDPTRALVEPRGAQRTAEAASLVPDLAGHLRLSADDLAALRLQQRDALVVLGLLGRQLPWTVTVPIRYECEHCGHTEEIRRARPSGGHRTPLWEIEWGDATRADDDATEEDSLRIYVDCWTRQVLRVQLVCRGCRRRQPGRCHYEKDIGRRWRRCDTITLDGNQFCSAHAPSPGVSAAAMYGGSERVAAKVQACGTPIGLPGCLSEMTGDEFELWLATVDGRVLFVPALGELFTVKCGGATPAPTGRLAAPT
jgi:hypothetical protein